MLKGVSFFMLIIFIKQNSYFILLINNTFNTQPIQHLIPFLYLRYEFCIYSVIKISIQYLLLKTV